MVNHMFLPPFGDFCLFFSNHQTSKSEQTHKSSMMKNIRRMGIDEGGGDVGENEKIPRRYPP